MLLCLGVLHFVIFGTEKKEDNPTIPADHFWMRMLGQLFIFENVADLARFILHYLPLGITKPPAGAAEGGMKKG